MLDRLLLDLRFAFRALVRRPGFSLVAVLALALGIGANVAIFSLANALLLRPPLADEPRRVVNLHAVSADGSGFHAFSYLDYLDYRRDNDAFEKEAFDEIGAWNFEMLSLLVSRPGSDDGSAVPRPAPGQVVSENYFRVFGVEPAAGRFFRPEEGQPKGEHPAVVVSHRLWSTDGAVELGSELLVNGHRMTVVGVAPAGFTGPFGAVATELWVPFSMLPKVDPRMNLEDRGAVWIEMVGRLAPGVTPQEAESFLDLRHDELARAHPASGDVDGGVDLSSFGSLPGQARSAVGIFVAVLMTVATLLLLITGVNVAGMLLSRAAERRHESVIRLALGAGRHHLLRQWIVETTVLFALGAVVGTLLAEWAVGLLLAVPLPLPISLSLDVGLDHRVVLFVFTLTLGTGVIFGLVPGLHAARSGRLSEALRDTSGSGGSRGRLRLRSAFVVGQVAAALVLLVLAGLFLRSLEGAKEIDPGFTVDGVHLATLDLGLASYSDAAAQDFYRRLVERAEAVPGVASASLVRMPHLGPGNSTAVIHVPGYEAPDNDAGLFQADQNTVSPGYFQTLEIPILRGRSFTTADRAPAEGGEIVTVVNRTLAQRFWPGEDPLGRRIRLGGPDAPWATIVGVAADAKYRSLGEEPRLYLYFPLAQDPSPQMTLLARAEKGVPLPPDALRRLVAELDPSLPVLQSDTLESQIGLALLPQRLASALAGGFGVLGLFLVTLGIYGITAFSVLRRTRELGVRRALGARRREIVGLVLRQGLGLGVVGVVLGSGLALLGGRLASSLLVATSPTDPGILAGVAFLLLVAVVAGSLVPAWRAARVDPMEALRYE